MPVWDCSTCEILGVEADCNELILHSKTISMIYTGLRKFLIFSVPSENISFGSPCQNTSGCNCLIQENLVGVKKCQVCNGEIQVQKVRSEIWLEGDITSGYQKKVLDFYDNGMIHTKYPGYRAECDFGRDHIAATMDFSCPLPSAPDPPQPNFAKMIRSNRAYSA